MNPEPHCQPPRKDGEPNKDATLFPVTVFLKHFDSYLSDGKAEWEKFKVEKAKGIGGRYSEVIGHIMNYRKDHRHPNQK